MVNLIFDYDGTIHESIAIYYPAFNKAKEYLESKGLITPKEYSEEEVSKWLGYTAKEMWDSFAPALSDEEKSISSGIIGKELVEMTESDKAGLYPMAEETLRELRDRGYTLIMISNCKRNYLDAHIKNFDLNKYFSAYYCAEDYDFTPKYKIFNEIKKNHRGQFRIIGDRYQDMEVAEKHNILSYGCLYGYGNEDELKGATERIESIYELVDLI